MFKLNSGEIQYCLGKNVNTEENLGIFGNLIRYLKWKVKEIQYGSTVDEQLSNVRYGKIINTKNINSLK